MDASVALARNVVRTRFDDLPAPAVEAAKRSILDALGTILAASTLEEGCRPLVELAREAGGREESTILAFGGRVPAHMAAFANGAMVHALDYEDVTDSPGGHPTAGTLPAALAMAERVGGVSGKDFITAVALGNDVVVRLGAARTRDSGGWMTPSIFGIFGGTAAAGKLLGLDEDQMIGAFGMALNQAAGSSEGAYGTDSRYRAIRDGFTGKAAVLSALLAQRGLVGARTAFQGKAGLYGLFFQGRYNSSPLTERLGEHFASADVSYKPWPSCRGSHTHLEAVLGLVQEHNILPEDVGRIRLTVGSFGRRLCSPLGEKSHPTSGVNAKFSLPYCVAVAVVRRKLVLDDFTPHAIRDPHVLQLARRVTWQFDRTRSRMGVEPAAVEIRCRDGKAYSRAMEFAYGNPRNPMSDADLAAKFRDCAAYSARPFPQATLDTVIHMVFHLEELPNISQIPRLLG